MYDVHLEDDGLSVRAGVDGGDLFTYVYRPRLPQTCSPRPYLHPVHTMAGEVVTGFQPDDHPWHMGLSWAVADLTELRRAPLGDPVPVRHNFWGGPTWVPDQGHVDLPDHGQMRHVAMTALSEQPARGTIGHRLDWFTAEGEVVVEELRTLTASVIGDDIWVLVVDLMMTAVCHPGLRIGSPAVQGLVGEGHGGLFWRGPDSFRGGLVQSQFGAGADNLNGRRAPWCAYRGRHDDGWNRSTVVIVDDPSNLQHPPQWTVHSADYAALGPAPFFTEETFVGPARSLRFRYAVVVADGDHGAPGTVELARVGAQELRT